MKIIGKHQLTTRLLLLVMLLIVPLCMKAQSNVTLQGEQITLREAFRAIEKQTGMSVDYDGTQINVNKVVNVRNVNGSVNQVLTTILKGTGYVFTITGKHIAINTGNGTQTASQQTNNTTKKVTGTVKDNIGEPVVGATVTAIGSNVRAITDVDGRYEMDVPRNVKSLEISYIGFVTQNVAIGNSGNTNISLQEDAQGLNEVVVVGYGTQKKANLIGAVSTVTANDLKDRPVNNLGQMLQGQVPNLNITYSSGTPGESTKLNIRGATSIVNSGTPLVLVDGVESSIDRINPNDVESISILKDAASAAIYGARAGFGVILITTKTNKDGKAHITYNGRFSWSAPTTNTDFITTGYDAITLVDAFQQAMYNSSYSNYDNAAYEALKARQNDATENPDRPWTVVGTDGKYHYYANFDWYNYIFDFSQPTWTHNLNISGGTEKFNYLVSGNMNDKSGVYALSTDKYHTRTITGKFTAQVNDWLKMTGSVKLYKSKYEQPGYDFEDGGNIGNLSFHAMPWLMPYNPDGTNVYTYAGNGNKPADGFVAMLRTGNGGTTVKQTQTIYSLNAVAHVFKGLDIYANASYKLYSKDKTFRIANIEYSEAPNTIQKATTGYFGNRLKEIHTEEEVWVYDLYANYAKSFNQAHNLNVIAGMNYEEERWKNIEASVYDLLSETLNDLQLGTGSKGVKGGQHEYALMGYFGRISYDYMNKYLVEANMRYDGTSRFPMEDRWGFFPSLALGWRFTEEGFMASTKDWLSNGKLRASIGSLGNQVTDGYSNPYYPYIRRANIVNTNSFNYIFDNQTASYVKLDAPVSGSLTWEKIVTKNLGLDLGLLNNRLTATIDIYQRDTKDMLATSLTLPDVYGYSAPLENNGHLRTKGYELTLSWNDRFALAGKPFSYGISASLADSKSKLIGYKGNETKVLGKNYEGMEWGEIWGYKIEGIYQSTAEATARGVDQSFLSNRFTNEAGDLIFSDIDKSKAINNGKGTLEDHGDLVKIGNSQPRYHYSFSLNANWNGIDFAAFFQGIGKQNIYPGGNNMMFWGPFARAYSSFIPSDFAGKVWSSDNLDSYFPRAAADLARTSFLQYPNDRYLQNVAYCRLKNLTVGYTLPKPLTKKIGIEAVRIYFSGENLFTISALDTDYLDPEQMTTDSNGRVYPFSKSFSFGIDVTF